MAAALRAAEGGGYIFPKSSGGYFQNFFGQGGYTPYPLIPDPWFNPILCGENLKIPEIQRNN